MNYSKRFLALFLVMIMALSFPLYALADEADDIDTDDGNSIETPNEQKGKSNGKGNAKGNDGKAEKPGKALKGLLKEQKDQVETVKDELEQEIDQLEASCQAAEESGDDELAAQLRLQLQEMKTTQESYKAQMKELIGQMKLTMRNRYTEQELEQLGNIAEELGQDPDLFVLPVENVISDTVNIKFDTPPVIKGNRTLIPVRAIVQGFGAEVSWDEDTQTVTIVKGDKEIVLTLGSSTIYVNGEEQEIDVPAGLINNRTFVPLRFLTQNLGLNVKWDQDTQTIDIDDGEDDQEEPEEDDEEEADGDDQEDTDDSIE